MDRYMTFHIHPKHSQNIPTLSHTSNTFTTTTNSTTITKTLIARTSPYIVIENDCALLQLINKTTLYYYYYSKILLVIIIYRWHQQTNILLKIIKKMFNL